ncbi:50S ribosomal protein L20 [Providencia rettgeri]|nr:50S ribosomal protein L20 [Providencia rettgeri]
MARAKRGVIARARHKKILKQAKGYYGARSRVYRVAFQAVIKLVNTLTVTAVNVNVSSVNCGSHVSTLRLVRTVCLTAASSMA